MAKSFFEVTTPFPANNSILKNYTPTNGNQRVSGVIEEGP